MYRFFLSAASIFVLFTSLILPPAAATPRCGERTPFTLLSLYRESDAIYVGRYEKTTDGEPTDDNADYTVVPITKHFTISNTLKGETRKFFTLEDTEYRYKNVQANESEDEEYADDEEEVEVIEPGDTVLLFIDRSEDSDLLVLTDYTDGIKKMTPEKLAAYDARIRELKSIFSTESPNVAYIVDWLVKCAENPLTRWEGTFELLQSFQNMDWQASQHETKANIDDDGSEQAVMADANTATADEEDSEAAPELLAGDPRFAKSLTDRHKQTLTNILMNRERPKRADDRSDKVVATRGDQELIELVKRWGDSGVAEHLLQQLRADSSDTYQNVALMDSISSILNDEDLTSLASEYSDIQWESDDQEIGEEEGSDEVETAEPTTDPAADQSETGDAVDETPAADADDTAEIPSEGDRAKKKTYGDLKAELLAKFLARADRVIERERNKEVPVKEQ